MGFPSAASEFPNDNAEISGGAIWVCAELTGPARLEPAPYQSLMNEPFVLRFDDDEGCLDAPIEPKFAGGELSVPVYCAETESESESETETESESESESKAKSEIEVEVEARQREAAAFLHFESALTAALMAQGASRSAALLPRLLRLEALPAGGLSKEVWLILQSRGYLDGNARYSQKFRALCGAWSAVLHGSSQDFAACGTTTLDRFGADLLAALLAAPATRVDELRRELRKAGIAAFGVLQAA